MRTRIKICGITRIEDALAAAQAGADAIGLVFYDASPRRVSVEQARGIIQVLPPFIAVVGLFVNPQPELVHQALNAMKLDLLQFHGEETPAECRDYGIPYIKAVRMHIDADLSAQAVKYHDATALLLDSYVPDLHGGSGETFDWGRVPREFNKPLILAGGLTPDNVAQAVAQVRPYAVDVSGGVEKSKGIKDAGKIAAFIKQVRGAY